MTGRAALLAALAASVVAALPADGREGSRPPVRDCAARAEGPSPPSDRPRRGDLAVGPVIFIGGRAHARSPRSDFAPVRPGRYQPVKLPVTVRAGRRVTIGTARRQRRAV